MSTNKIIQRAAFDMFRNWTKVAAEKYPNIDFTIKDETELVNDTNEAIIKALKNLFLPEKAEDRQNKYWCIGFVDGFIKGNLGVKWHTDYILMQTDNYRYLMAVKSILEYVKVDSDLGWRLDNIYKELFKLINLENINLKTKVDESFFHKYELSPRNKSGIVIQALDNLTVMLTQKMLKEQTLTIPDKEYFSNEEILSFIDSI